MMRNLLKSGSDSKTPGCNHCRRLLSWITVCVLLIGGLLSAEAVDNSQSYDFRVTVNGAEKIIVEPGDTITLVLSLSRTDTDDELMNIYSVSSVLRFHSRILELKDLQTGSGISSTVTKRSGSLEGWTILTGKAAE